MFCSKCGKELPENTKICENCGNQISKPKEKTNGCLLGCLITLAVLFVVFIVIPLFVGIIFSPTIDNNASNSSTSTTTNKSQSALYKATKNHARPLNVIENKVADDTVEQYNIVKRQGDKIQICVQAGIVAAAYLQAKDEKNYSKWQSIKKSDCRAAGIPY